MNQSYFKSNDFEDKKLVRDKNVPLFFFIFVFSIQLTVNNAQFNFADDWIQTVDLWCQKRLLYQLSHNHCPTILAAFCPATQLTFTYKIFKVFFQPFSQPVQTWRRAEIVQPWCHRRHLYTKSKGLLYILIFLYVYIQPSLFELTSQPNGQPYKCFTIENYNCRV